MRLKITALVASALAGFLYVSVPSASALPAPARGDVTTPNAKTGAITEEVRWRRRGYRRWGGYRSYGYRPYGYYGYRRPYYYGGYGGYGYPYYYRRRPGFGIYLGF
ncbi:MAG: hypothetical protein H7Y62_09780 [Hyphomicrobium sp.]|nr:hypothetical protein [Hyphomicrobium sp.]